MQRRDHITLKKIAEESNIAINLKTRYGKAVACFLWRSLGRIEPRGTVFPSRYSPSIK